MLVIHCVRRCAFFPLRSKKPHLLPQCITSDDVGHVLEVVAVHVLDPVVIKRAVAVDELVVYKPTVHVVEVRTGY